jgi:hypothetical protein
MMDISAFCGPGLNAVTCDFVPFTPLGGRGAAEPPAARLVVALQLLGGAPTTASHRAAVVAHRSLPRDFAEFAAHRALALRCARVNASLAGGGGGGAPAGEQGGTDLASCALAFAPAPLGKGAAPAAPPDAPVPATAPAPAPAAADSECTVPLTDPLLLCTLRVPVRGDLCQHAEALDLDSYLLANAAPGARWECPLCVKARARSALLLPCHLWVDTFMADALNRLRATLPAEKLASRRLQLVPGAPWRLWPPVAEAAAPGGAAAGEAGEADVTVVSLDGEEDQAAPWGASVLLKIDAATAEAARQAAAAAVRRARAAREAEAAGVVDLTHL